MSSRVTGAPRAVRRRVPVRGAVSPDVVSGRLRITKTGKVIRGHTRMNHFLEKKSAARKRRLSQSAVVSGKYARNIKRKLGV